MTVSTGIITTIAGTGVSGFNGDGGQATSATLNSAIAVALDSAGSNRYMYFHIAISCVLLTYSQFVTGNVYIADSSETGNHRIRKVTVSTGIISTVAGTGDNSYYNGDGGDATSASLNKPFGVALDTSGRRIFNIFYSISSLYFDITDNIFIGDTNNHRIRKVTVSTGIISTIAGTGSGGYSGDNGAATSATLNNPWEVKLDASGRQAEFIVCSNLL